jgi:Uma2 family endonuclease
MATDIIGGETAYTLPEEFQPDVEHLVTEDGAPVDGQFSEKQMRLLTEPLYSSWVRPEGRPFVAMANVGLFYQDDLPPLVPDAMLSLDVSTPMDLSLKKNRSYFIWRYGKPPDVVVEVVSNREGGEDTDRLAKYAAISVRYYAIYDPDRMLGAETLRVWARDAVGLQRVKDPVWFPAVGLGMRLWEGRYEDFDATWLRWVDADGALIPTGCERADAERQRAERLVEQLRQHGIQPLKP